MGNRKQGREGNCYGWQGRQGTQKQGGCSGSDSRKVTGLNRVQGMAGCGDGRRWRRAGQAYLRHPEGKGQSSGAGMRAADNEEQVVAR